MAATTDCAFACMVCSIFIASRTTSASPSATAWPGATRRRTIFPGIGAMIAACRAASDSFAESRACACAARSRTANWYVSPPVNIVTSVSRESSVGGSITAVPVQLSPLSVARKDASADWSNSRRVHSEGGASRSAEMEISSAEIGSALAVSSGGLGAAWRKKAKKGAPEGLPSMSSGWSSRGDAPAPPHTEEPRRRKGWRAHTEPGGSAAARRSPCCFTHWLTARESSLCEGGAGTSGSSSALCSSMKAVCTRPSLKASVWRIRLRNGTLVGKPTTFQSSSARWRARSAASRSGPRVISFAIIGS
mmetsp:Transcript_41750/g.103743  ORF Transcript_41750/g.103743 Transcript_41750/m.103743 type:complete len:306 (+) Transcript_41750:363-1280(+)